MVQGVGFKVWCWGFRIKDSEFGVQVLGLRIWGLRFAVYGLWFRVYE